VPFDATSPIRPTKAGRGTGERLAAGRRAAAVRAKAQAALAEYVALGLKHQNHLPVASANTHTKKKKKLFNSIHFFAFVSIFYIMVVL
jgi:hypothetical protein